MSIEFNILKRLNNARVGELITPHGIIKTPIYMPVGTAATVKALSSEDVLGLNAQIILGNTYHLHLRPGEETIHKLGGLHTFMNWEKPILTDSGGFQVFSLGSGSKVVESSHSPQIASNISVLTPKLEYLKQTKSLYRRAKIDEDGVTFYSHIDGSLQRLTPEISVEIQQRIGADIIMAFDECSPVTDKTYTQAAMERTHRWLVRSKSKWLASPANQSLFGIIQGGNFKNLRLESARFVNEQELPGVAIGGVSVGYYMDQTVEHIGWVKEVISEDKPFYAMGVGRDPQDIVDMVLSGVDMFDCVAPTRLARNGAIYHGRLVGNNFNAASESVVKFESEFGKKGRLQIGNAEFKQDNRPIMEECDCATCQAGYSRAYLKHLYRSKELLYYRLASIHNVRFMIRLCEELRARILEI